MNSTNRFLLFILALLLPSFLFAAENTKSISENFGLDLNKPLPNWLDNSREKAQSLRELRTVPNAVTPADFRIPAEYEPVGAVVLGWAGYTDMLASIAKAASSAGAQVWAIGGPSKINGVLKYLALPMRLDSVWVRDYGPFGISSKTNTVGIVDAIYRHYQYRMSDDAVPQNLGRIMHINVYGMNIILDGGNLMVDSYGNLFMTKRTYLWNSHLSKSQVDNALKTALRVKNIYKFDYAGYPNEPEDGTGHIDMFMKLLNDHTVLIAKTSDEPYKSNNDKAIKFFNGRTAPDGLPYKVLISNGWVESGVWHTYTNALIVNNTVVMPSYRGHDAEEQEAIKAYKAGMSGVKVVPVNSDNSIASGGSIHCVTQNIPAASNLSRLSKEISEVLQSVSVPLQYSETETKKLPNNPIVDELIKQAEVIK